MTARILSLSVPQPAPGPGEPNKEALLVAEKTLSRQVEPLRVSRASAETMHEGLVHDRPATPRAP